MSANDGFPTSEILLRLSLVEGFTASHLRRFRRLQECSPTPGRDEGAPAGGALLEKGLAALVSREGEERAARVRDACGRLGIRIDTLCSGDYPAALREIPDAPLVIYRMGNRACACAPEAVAVVGSRAPTSPAVAFTRRLAKDLAEEGLPVVSGMARGIDTAAHEGALAAGGVTVAVLGCGVDVLYPPESGPLRDRILAGGELLSEYPPGTRPAPYRFPARNRIVSGLCRAVVVAEAPARSGALITARLALDQGKEVLAVPGNPLFPHTAGSNRLLSDGAAPVTGAEDVLRAIGHRRGGTDRLGREILDFLSRERHVDEIAGRFGLTPAGLFPRLLEFEAGKLIRKRPGDYYRKM